MELIIKQKQFTFFGNKYEIFEADDLIFTAESFLYLFGTKIKVLNKENIEEITLIAPFLNNKFKILFSGGSYFSINKNFKFKSYFTIRIPAGTIEVHKQKGLQLAIFFNNEQVAEISKKAISHFGGDEFKIIANSEINKEFLIGICLGWDMLDFGKKDLVRYDLGRIGSVKRKAEANWKPVK